jgi:Secretion system C-terminal sorting domain
LVNFSDYDNWSSSANYTHSNAPDGTVDMIVMVWRCSVLPFPFGTWSGIADLGGSSSYTVEGGTKTIKTYFGLNAGSGVTLHYWGERTQERNFKDVVHEIGHWLLGGSHPYTNSPADDEHKVWGMLTRGDDGICANTYEWERVAWVNPTSITGDILNAPLQDYVQYGTTYKYHPSNGSTDEYFYFENHQQLSSYDNATNNTNDKGIFVIHQQGAYNSTNNIRVKASNGQWDWQQTGTTDCFGGSTVPKFKPTTVNRSGRNNKDKLLKTGSGSEWLFYLDGWTTGTWPSGGCGGWLNGEGLNNAFNLTNNDVFSNYSNPWARRWTNDTTNNFTMEVIAQNGSVVNAKFYITNPTSGKPSKPQNLRVSLNPSDSHVRLDWDGNIDPDLSLYEISRKVNLGSWSVVTTTTNLYWVDPNWAYNSSPFDVSYRIRAKDSQNYYSIYSDIVICHPYPMGKKAFEIASSDMPAEYGLSNYPNPFNPSTNIIFKLKERGFVSLKVHDILGKEIANLVNEEKEAGTYEIFFDGAKLPSGIYFYSISAGDFHQTQKMLLIK